VKTLSSLRGRIRLRDPRFKDPRLSLEKLVESPGVLKAERSFATGSILVFHDPALISSEEIRRTLSEILAPPAAAPPLAGSPFVLSFSNAENPEPEAPSGAPARSGARRRSLLPAVLTGLALAAAGALLFFLGCHRFKSGAFLLQLFHVHPPCPSCLLRAGAGLKGLSTAGGHVESGCCREASKAPSGGGHGEDGRGRE
jgi:hypothetical protein